jgi:uncharacterized protein YndB with AHSA1/START domain
MFKKVLLGVVAVVLLVVVVLVVAISLQPSEFSVSRTATMAAPPADAFEQVNDFHNWQAWSPWEMLDPAMQRTFEGPASGKGAVYSWVGNSEVGEGRMTIAESRPNELIRINLDFIAPFESTNTTEFTFKPEGDETVVVWTMSGQNNFMSKAFHLFMDVEAMVGGDFEKGLAAMKAKVEGEPQE